MVDHDALYHRLFSHPGMVAQLLRDFVAEPWLDDLDLSAMERINAKFHGRGGERRDGDVIWRIPMRQEGEAYLVLLLEFQSTPERWMALRALVYVGLLWQQLIREKRLAPDGRLPPVLPIVLYNGDPRWAMPLSLREQIGLPEDSPFWHWQPEMRYHIIDEGAFPADDLAARDSLAALLFRLEHCHDIDQIGPLIDAVIVWFRQHPAFEPLAAVFAMLAGRLTMMQDGASPGVRVSENLLEVKTMLATRFEEWKRQWELKGELKGERIGQQIGESRLLGRQLERRFGPLPDWAQQRLTAADLATLDEWGMRLLEVKTLDEIFQDGSRS